MWYKIYEDVKSDHVIDFENIISNESEVIVRKITIIIMLVVFKREVNFNKIYTCNIFISNIVIRILLYTYIYINYKLASTGIFFYWKK